MRALVLASVSMVTLLTIPVSAGPLFLYSYSGAPLSTAPTAGVSDFPTIGTAPTGLSAITFSMTGEKLKPNLSMAASTGRYFPQSWSISDGVRTISSHDVLPPKTFLNLYFEFSTDTQGVISEWYVQVLRYNSSDPPPGDQSGWSQYEEWNDLLLRTAKQPATTNPFFYDESRLCSAQQCDYGRTKDYRAVAINQPGAWTVSESPAPPQGVPDAGATIPLLALSISTLGLLSVRSRR